MLSLTLRAPQYNFMNESLIWVSTVEVVSKRTCRVHFRFDRPALTFGVVYACSMLVMYAAPRLARSNLLNGTPQVKRAAQSTVSVRSRVGTYSTARLVKVGEAQPCPTGKQAHPSRHSALADSQPPRTASEWRFSKKRQRNRLGYSPSKLRSSLTVCSEQANANEPASEEQDDKSPYALA